MGQSALCISMASINLIAVMFAGASFIHTICLSHICLILFYEHSLCMYLKAVPGPIPKTHGRLQWIKNTTFHYNPKKLILTAINVMLKHWISLYWLNCYHFPIKSYISFTQIYFHGGKNGCHWYLCLGDLFQI